MPSPSRSILRMPMSAQSSLSHCTTTRPGMVAGSSGTMVSRLAAEDDHAAGVLAEMTRQVLHREVELEELADARIFDIEAGIAELLLRRVGGVLPLPGANQAREARDRLLVEAHHLADVARRRAAAVGDDVRRHGGAALAEVFVDVLDGALAAVAAGQVDVDVRPLAAFLGEEALEQQLHADRIDRGDAERVADRAVRGRPAALAEDAALPAELDDVPDDQEVAFELAASRSA